MIEPLCACTVGADPLPGTSQLNPYTHHNAAQEEMKQAAEQAKKRNAWESAGGDDQDKAMELMASKVRWRLDGVPDAHRVC